MEFKNGVILTVKNETTKMNFKEEYSNLKELMDDLSERYFNDETQFLYEHLVYTMLDVDITEQDEVIQAAQQYFGDITEGEDGYTEDINKLVDLAYSKLEQVNDIQDLQFYLRDIFDQGATTFELQYV